MRAGTGSRRSGFTLVELVVVMTLLGVLASVGAPRFFASRAYEADFYYQDVASALRFTQRLAVATGCPVELRFTGSDYALAQRESCQTGAFNQSVTDPSSGATGYSGQAPAGTTITSSVNPIVFDALGRALDPALVVSDVDLTIGGRGLRVAGETGFVHVPGS